MLTLASAIATVAYMYATVIYGIGDGKFLPLLVVVTLIALGLDSDKKKR
jgi:hypothetical protein